MTNQPPTASEMAHETVSVDEIPFKYWRPDEVAECVEGVFNPESPELYQALWAFVADYEKGNRDES